MKKSIRIQKVIIGICMSLIGMAILLGKIDISKLISTDTYATEPIRISGFDNDNYNELTIPIRVIIPSASIDLSVRKAEIVSGYWQVFEESAAWGSGSAIPGEKGNQVIFAHAREGLFLPLRKVNIDDNIYILTENGYFVYRVSGIDEVNPDQVEVISPTEDETLTLYTCSGFKDSKRLIVVAKRLL